VPLECDDDDDDERDGGDDDERDGGDDGAEVDRVCVVGRTAGVCGVAAGGRTTGARPGRGDCGAVACGKLAGARVLLSRARGTNKSRSS